jgi:glutamyl-tRNA synthetase/glutamyl-Q tRNA(Asp) synthetase
VLLRIEDHDRQRSRPEYERSILEDLEWLGFAPDEPLVRQSERGALYAEALNRLRSAGVIYACDCARSERYPGTCSAKQLPERAGLSLRVRMAPETITFVDLRHGPQSQRPSEQCGDMVVKDREGNWTYQFAVTVDDYLQGVDLVIRGDDLLESTGRQIQLARLLGRHDTPAWFHHPLIMKSPAQKLSKSDGDAGVRELRAGGATAADVIGRAALLGGLLETFRPIPAAEVPSLITK